MINIRCVYEADPGFPATDQHPDAVRYKVGGYVVDAVGGEPTIDEVNAVRNPPPQKMKYDDLPQTLREVVSVSEKFAGKTEDEARTAFDSRDSITLQQGPKK